MGDGLRLALWQGRSPAGDIAGGVTVLGRALRAAGAMGAACLVAPEVWLPGYNQPDMPSRAMPLDAAPLRQLAEHARAAGCGLVAGFAEADGSSVRNSALCLDANGQTLDVYRKIQLYGAREAAIYRPGDVYAIFEIAGRRAAALICYDVEFAQHVKALADRGVEVLLVPTANMQPFTHVVRHTVPAMAANHGMTIVYANLCGTEGDLTYVGGSLIAGPHGEVLAQAGEGPALLVADVPDRDPARLSTQALDFRAV